MSNEPQQAAMQVNVTSREPSKVFRMFQWPMTGFWRWPLD
jgi:hypothetical protein